MIWRGLLQRTRRGARLRRAASLRRRAARTQERGWSAQGYTAGCWRRAADSNGRGRLKQGTSAAASRGRATRAVERGWSAQGYTAGCWRHGWRPSSRLAPLTPSVDRGRPYFHDRHHLPLAQRPSRNAPLNSQWRSRPDRRSCHVPRATKKTAGRCHCY